MTKPSTRKKATDVWDEPETDQPNSIFNNAVEEARKIANPTSETGALESGTTTKEMVIAPSSPIPQPNQVTEQPPQPLKLPEIQNTGKPEIQKPDRAGPGYTKATHRIRDDAFQALEDMKLLLKRKHGFKRILLEEIVEEAILGIKRDLDEHQGQSILVQRLREQKLPEKQ